MNDRNIPPEVQRKMAQQIPFTSDLYSYQAQILTFAAGATQSVNINIEADSYFVIDKLSYFCRTSTTTLTEATRLIPIVTCQITDTGSGRNLMSAPVQISALAGHEGLPFVLPINRWLKPNSTLQFEFVNQSAQEYSDFTLYLHGEKRWY